MSRETKIITTPVDKQKITLNAWISGREKRELRDILLAGMKMDKEGKVVTDPTITTKTEDKAIEMIVVSVNDKNEDILNKILDMKSKDFDFVIDEINSVREDKDFLA